MQTVVKGTKTIAEYKEIKNRLELKAKELFEEHKSHFENWKEGDIVKVWIDDADIICIQYESGNWWHYNNGVWW